MSDEPKLDPNHRADLTFADRAGEAWVRLQDQTDAVVNPFGRAAMARLPLAAGARVLDVGCGCGQTLLQLADAVGTAGSVVGVDVSPPMLAQAKERAAARPEISLVLADAQKHAFPPAGFDALFSRFGVMFFQDARAAFANLRAALRPGGRLAFVCWQAFERNPWAAEPLAAVMRRVPGQPVPEMLRPDRPGPFYLATPERIRTILGDAGFASIAVDPCELPVHIGGAATLAEAVTYCQQIGPAARAMADAPEAARPAIQAALAESLAPFATNRGVFMDGAAWIVTALSP
jgi:SAM-dependent methyltransferase